MRKEFLFISSIFVLGFSTFLVQVAFLREYLAVYNGNEIGIGLFFGGWMFSNALGAFFGNRLMKNLNITFGFVLFHILLAFVPFLSSFLGYFIKGEFFHPGEMISLSNLLWISFIYLFPFCFIAGAFFPFTSFVISDIKRENLIGKSYAFESLGAIFGALIINLLILNYVELKSILLIVLITNLAFFYIHLLFWKQFQIVRALLFVLVFIFGFIVYGIDYKQILEKYLYKNQQIEKVVDTRYGNIVVTDIQGEKNVFLNNSHIINELQVSENEEKVHFPMLLYKKPKNILVIGASSNGIFNELNKYAVEKVDYVEPNQKLVDIIKEYMQYNDDRNINYIHSNILQFLNTSNILYDVILLNSGNPATIIQNTFISDELIRKIKSHLADNGIFMTYIDVNYNYLSDAEKQLTSIVYKTIEEVFKYIKIVAGKHLYFIASDKKPDKTYLSALNEKSFENVFVNEYYIDDRQIDRIEKYVRETINSRCKKNSIFYPSALNASLKIWEEKAGLKYAVSVLLVLLIFFVVLKADRTSFPVIIAGILGSALQTIVILLFQLYFGSIYHYIGLITGLFMLGLAIGAYFTKEKYLVKTNKRIKLISILFCFEFALLVFLIDHFDIENLFLMKFVVLSHSIIFGVIIGQIFTIASYKSKRSLMKTSSAIYGLDMLGATIGAIGISAIAIPQFGIVVSVFILLAINSLILTIK